MNICQILEKFINDLKKINLFFSDPLKAVNFINNLSNFDKMVVREKRQKNFRVKKIMLTFPNIILMIGIKY